MNLNVVNQVLNALGRRDRIGQLGLGSNGCAGLSLADGTGVYFEWSEPEQALHLYSPLTDQPSATQPSAKPALYRALLGMNCLANGPVIAMHPEQERFYVQMRFAAGELTYRPWIRPSTR
ncbi:type III secretion system chaperone [Pseudomonas syringae]|uniref:Type III secretion system chaperone n=1 Tax=Pseudomonas syringae pv. papulans TaxID=83963 RepID=A0AA43DPQ9_PSESX|nr:type III secretion system chaperone [Pseudomonas syringae]MDH4606188.1 type III secretion system chaperone [Pseudomonas syringae pv. papulans]MDH4620264.1 type III secretion system chaperone [Pseudomonas syringae pv. papulans]